MAMRKRNCLGWITFPVILFTVQPGYSCCYWEGEQLVQKCRAYLRGEETGGRVSNQEVMEAAGCVASRSEIEIALSSLESSKALASAI
jgi:hypothetical protein